MISDQKKLKLVKVFISFRHFSCSKGPLNRPFQYFNTKSIVDLHFIRPLSTKDVFFKEIADLTTQIPPPPLPPGAKQSLAELSAAGVSILNDLELWSWWKPSSWLRWGFESIHFYTDWPWWGVIAALTFLIRVTLIYVPIKMQRFNAKQSLLAPELNKFKARVLEAKTEGDHMLVHQIMMEQNDFMKQKGISPLTHFPLIASNCLIFMAQFFAIKEMANAKYPGWQDGGISWFTDLTVGDPYWSGVDVGSVEAMSSVIRPFLLYAFPAFMFVFASQFPSALCVYWVTNNMLSMMISFTFKRESVRRLLDLPKNMSNNKSAKSEFTQALRDWKSNVVLQSSSRKNMRQADYEQFQKAGRGKPILLVENQELENEEKIKLTTKKTI
uniref:Mitochondrial inner membrane protein OXA1L n=1 Tax=Meloidogyne hapla TaxID=6305 RepID=A0A1I8BD99_MELHA